MNTSRWMKLTAFLLVTCHCWIVRAAEARADAQTDREALQGEWTVLSQEDNGERTPALHLAYMTLVIRGDSWTYTNGLYTMSGTFKLSDTSKEFRVIDCVLGEGPFKGQTVPGIYEIKDGRLKLCLGEPGKKRPTEFSAVTTSGNEVTVCQRSQKKEGGEAKSRGIPERGLLGHLVKQAEKEGSHIHDVTQSEVEKLQAGKDKEGVHLSHVAKKTMGQIHNSPAYKKLIELMLPIFMDRPDFTKDLKINPDLPGNPIYYVNGMYCPKSLARSDAEALSKKFGRPVYIIMNPSFLDKVATGTPNKWPTGTPNCVDDFAEACYDYAWPEKLTGLGNTDDLMNWAFSGGSAAILASVASPIPTATLPKLAPSPQFVQLNPTARQVAYVIYHADRPISIVSHSQGCLQVRNANLALALLGKEDFIKKHVAWVAAGNPVNENLRGPTPANYNSAVNSADPVGVIVGLRLGKRTFEAAQFNDPKHDFAGSYLPKIQTTWLFDPQAGLSLADGGQHAPGGHKIVKVTFTNGTRETVHFQLTSIKGTETLAPNQKKTYELSVADGVTPVVAISQRQGKPLDFTLGDHGEYEFHEDGNLIKNHYAKDKK